MKTIVYLLLLVTTTSMSQSKLLTKTGVITFEASVASFEEVAAKNSSVTAILNTENGDIAALALVKGFRFKNALMEEHFNENYAESDTYPKATFSGTIVDFDWNKMDAESSTFFLNGTLTFHGQTKALSDIPLTISKINDVLTLRGQFEVVVSDFNIKIPNIVKNKVSERVLVAFAFDLKEK